MNETPNRNLAARYYSKWWANANPRKPAEVGNTTTNTDFSSLTDPLIGRELDGVDWTQATVNRWVNAATAWIMMLLPPLTAAGLLYAFFTEKLWNSSDFRFEFLTPSLWELLGVFWVVAQWNEAVRTRDAAIARQLELQSHLDVEASQSKRLNGLIAKSRERSRGVEDENRKLGEANDLLREERMDLERRLQAEQDGADELIAERNQLREQKAELREENRTLRQARDELSSKEKDSNELRARIRGALLPDFGDADDDFLAQSVEVAAKQLGSSYKRPLSGTEFARLLDDVEEDD